MDLQMSVPVRLHKASCVVCVRKKQITENRCSHLEACHILAAGNTLGSVRKVNVWA